MTFVDHLKPIAPAPHWPYTRHAHLFADDLAELHDIARTIGLQRHWFQPGPIPHYDLTESKHRLARVAGATELPTKQIILRLRTLPAQNPCPSVSICG